MNLLFCIVDVMVLIWIPLKRRKADIPIYSFEKHQREKETTPLYSPHVLILEGILAFSDPRIVEMLDVKA